MQLEKKTGVNYDYILALKKEGDRVKVVEYPINRHNKEIDRAIERYEDESCDADDVYSVVWRCLYSETYPYCLAHEYTSTYIDDIKPVKFDAFEYRKTLRELLDREINHRLRWLPKSEINNSEKKREIEIEVRKRLYPKIKKTKEILLSASLAYIYALDYADTISSNRIKQDCIVYSSERHGDGRDKHKIGYHAEHKINEDLSVRVETNFCYGSSTYFSVVVTYKGIELLPYSVWVRYYYAGFAHLLKYTRSYVRQRNSWHLCMNFLESFINSAIDNPENFIHNEVMREVNGLLEGLKIIFKQSQEDFEKEIKVKERPGDERYIGILGARYANESDENEYSIKPREVSMIYRMEKISGALRFLNNLRKIKEIYSEVSDAIDKIIEMNQKIYPEVVSAIPPVENEIKKLNEELSPLNKRLNVCEVSYEKLQVKLNKQLLNVCDSDKIKEIKERFEKYNPSYKKLAEEIDILRGKINTLKSKIYKRESVLKRLAQYKFLILRYAI